MELLEETPRPAAVVDEESEHAEMNTLLKETTEKSVEFIKDRVMGLDADEMEVLVAGILGGMGYRARVSPKGRDRGVDIFASPDGLGLEQPRIFVEVKHRKGQRMGAPDIRSFLGGRRQGDSCLYVSTGGFTVEARMEAERSAIPLTLLTADDLVELLIKHYEKLEGDTKALVPLVKLYWPV